MSIFRLLPFSLLIAVGVASVAAQSSPEKTPAAAIQSPDSGETNSSPSVDLLSPNLKAGVNASNSLDRILSGDYRPQLNQFSMPYIFRSQPEQEDELCLKMRIYKVARDDPHSDSTHAAGYTTCQPATRFRLHTAEERVLRPTP
jgi:hypothetical protein